MPCFLEEFIKNMMFKTSEMYRPTVVKLKYFFAPITQSLVSIGITSNNCIEDFDFFSDFAVFSNSGAKVLQ